MIEYSENNNNCVVIGPTQGSDGKLSYGGVIYIKKKVSLKHKILGPDYKMECDTFNANCVLIPYNYFEKCGAIDKHYIHSIGDFDYGLKLKRQGYKLLINNKYVGICDRNSKENTWNDKKLKIIDRIKKKESAKGLPLKQNFYYCRKNFNLFLAIKTSITPYIKILLKK